MFWVIVAIVLTSIALILLKPTKLGLDLVGGSRLVLEAQPTEQVRVITQEDMEHLQFAIEQRVNKLGVAETVVQQIGDKRLLVEIPAVTDLKEAKAFIGETAQLEFKKPAGSEKGIKSWESTGLTGSDLSRAQLTTDSSGQWVVSLEFNSVGAKKFAELTEALVGQEMAIFFDGELQSSPVIREAIYGGNAQISGGDGGFEYEEAKRMVDLLNAGALPIPAEIVEENTVGPTLGADSIAASKKAGIIGLGAVVVFMILFYHVPGVIATIALGIYSLILFALFKAIPVTLTLACRAGPSLSIGLSSDGSLFLFGRTKVKLRDV